MIVLLDVKKPIHREYMRHLFAYEQEAYSVFRHNTFGKALCAMVNKSDLPVRHEITDRTVRIRLPHSKAIRSHKNHFLYYSAEDQHKLNDMLEVLFTLDFESYYYAGMRLGLLQKEVIQQFIVSRKLVSMIGDVETLKKREYRKQQMEMEKLQTHLLQQVWYRERVIKKTIEEAYRLKASPL